MATHLLDILEKIAATNSRKAKSDILERHAKHPELRPFFIYALDPYRRFYLKKIPKAEPRMWASTMSFKRRLQLLDSLATRMLTGRSAEDEVRYALSIMNANDQEIFRRIILKDPKCKVAAETINALWPGTIPDFKVALCGIYEEKLFTKEGMWGEVKHNGMRVIAFVGTNHVEFFSRGGRPVRTLDHLIAPLLRYIQPGTMLDGEALVGGVGLEKSLSAIKRKSAKTDELADYQIFDAMPVLEFKERICFDNFEERRWHLAQIQLKEKEANQFSIYISQPVRLDTPKDAAKLFAKVRKAGGEGIILKEPKSPYEFGRSKHWLKYKPEDNIDVVITGWKKHKHPNKLGAFLFELDGRPGSCGTGLTDKQRRDYWKRRKELVGVTLEMTLTDRTAKGSAQHPRFVRLREHDGARD